MELQRKELLFRFTGTHPVLQALNDKVAFLRAERDAINRPDPAPRGRVHVAPGSGAT